MELRELDFRNAKYQGYTKKKEPSGFGLMIDEQYSFIAGEWSNWAPIGQTLIIFADSMKLYGDLTTMEILVCSGHDYCLYKSQKFLVLDCWISKYILKLEQKKPNEHLRIINEKNYANSPQMRSAYIDEFLQAKLPEHYKSYTLFAKRNFKQKNRELIEIYETSKEYYLSFRKESIFVKLMKTNERLISMGYRKENDKRQVPNAEMGRRYIYHRDYCNWTVEQYIESRSHIEFQYTCSHGNQASSPPQQQQIRPKQCIKNLREYFKCSLSFVNKYVNLKKIYSLKNEFQSYYQQIIRIEGGKYAQIQLENNGYKLDKNGNPIIDKQTKRNYKQVTIQQLKNELVKISGKNRSASRREGDRSREREREGERRRNSREVDRSRSRVMERERERDNDKTNKTNKINKMDRSCYQPSFHYTATPSSYKIESPSKYQATPKTKYKYLDEPEHHQRSSSERNPETPIRNYKYQEQNRRRQISPIKSPNLSQLTSAYRYIENEIKVNTPKAAKSKSPYINRYQYLDTEDYVYKQK